MNKSLQTLSRRLYRHSSVLYWTRCASSKLGQSTILIQDGLHVQELPIIVRRLSGKDLIVLDNTLVRDDENKETVPETNSEEELDEIVNGFKRCHTAEDIFKILGTMPVEEVSPLVALHALEKTYELDSNKVFRNDYAKYLGSDDSENFTRTAVLNQLIDRIAQTPDNDILVRGLSLLSKDIFKSNTNQVKVKLKEEIILRISQNKFTLEQVCNTVRILSDSGNRKYIDTLWVGITERFDEINENNFISVFKTLLFFKKSRGTVTNTLERKMIAVWFKLKSQDICELLQVLNKTQVPSHRFLEVTSKWLHTNIHTLKEEELKEIILQLSSLEYRDGNIENSLERYVKMKGIQVKDPSVMAIIMDYCTKFRIRSVHILQGCAEYLIVKHKELTPIEFKSLFTPFGLLVYNPLNGLQFWQTVEDYIENKFVQFKPTDLLDIMLACIYLQRYPLNFQSRIFNPFFLDRLQTQSFTFNQLQRIKLKILDTALHIDCSQYDGPLLPQYYQTVVKPMVDGRIKRICHAIHPHLNSLIGYDDRISLNVLPPFLPHSDIYVIDILVHPSFVGRTMLKMNLNQGRAYTAILIHVPEHYCSDGSLTGPQAMRIRHLEKTGFHVVTLQHKMLSKLITYPQELVNHIKSELKMKDKSKKTTKRP